jgi:hypothetical protein
VCHNDGAKSKKKKKKNDKRSENQTTKTFETKGAIVAQVQDLVRNKKKVKINYMKDVVYFGILSNATC